MTAGAATGGLFAWLIGPSVGLSLPVEQLACGLILGARSLRSPGNG